MHHQRYNIKPLMQQAMLECAMVIPKTYYIWSVLTTVIAESCSVSLQEGYSRLRYGYRLDRKMIDSFVDYSILDCVEDCLRRKRCKSVSYYGGAKYCEINYENKTTAPNKYLESAGWVYSEREDWDKTITGPCAFSNCEMNQACQPLPFAKHKCVLTDCGIPKMHRADMDEVGRWDAIAIGRMVHPRCINQDKHIGRLLCSKEGHWIVDRNCALWIGANDLDKENEFTWRSSKTPLLYSNWNNKQPNDSNDNQVCAVLKESGKWNDIKCERQRNFICEKALK
ncbi:mannose-binding protein C-like isoform X2 [Ostrea edulis]|uniref:mannose-binding protein C-like isoform X2 n=1 Tax=Ostrea edulis TaxID=37623 RepID=UPI0024AEDF05|nr:mannose-binding protein C-like isoform X2 [Ostrea edulis]